MLVRLRRDSPTTDRVPPEEEPFEPVDTEQVLLRYGLLRRLLVWLRAVISGRERTAVVAEDLLAQLGASIRSTHPGLLDLRKGLFLDPFYRRMLRLQSSARFFAAPLEQVWKRSRPQFLALLLGLDLPQVQQRLLHDTDPRKVAADEPHLPEHQLKKKLITNVMQILELMPYQGRDRFYANARFLDALYRLSHGPFDQILVAFDDAGNGDHVAPLSALRQPLTGLLEILSAVKNAPSDTLLEAIALFWYNDELERGDSDVEKQLVTTVRNSAHHLRNIWDCAAELPLHDIVRFVRRDINFAVPAATGGEDWFALLKQFWCDRADRAFTAYTFAQQKLRALEKAAEHTDGVRPVALEGYPRTPDGYARHAASLGVLRAVLDGPFAGRMHRPLKTLLIEGEFYKAANREEYTAAFNGLLEAGGTIETLQNRLSPEGDFGRTRRLIEQDTAPRADRLQRFAELAGQVDHLADVCVRATLEHLRVIRDVVHGILYGEVGGKYDTLANLGTIGGRSHQDLMHELDDAMKRAKECREVLGAVFDIENSIARRTRTETRPARAS